MTLRHLTASLLGLGVALHPVSAQAGAARGDSSIATYCVARSGQSSECTLYHLSMVQLLANPELFEGKRVLVTGFVHLEFEGTAIYLHREDSDANLVKNALWVDFRPGVLRDGVKYNDRYLLVSGVFTSRSRGHMGMFSGELSDIDRADVWPSRVEVLRLIKPRSRR